MNLILWAVLLLWGVPQTSGGSIDGTIQAQTGGPAADVRVVAVAVPDTAVGAAEPVVFESITQTDSNGRYRLGNISPGRYYVAAGPVYIQTFHPGTLTQSEASIVTVTRESPSVRGVDFTLITAASVDTAKGWEFVGGTSGTLTCCRLMVRLLMEDKSRVPDLPRLRVSERRSKTAVLFTSNPNQKLSGASIQIYVPVNSTAEIAVEDLPAGYVLKSVSYGGNDFGLNPFLVDGKSLANLDLTLGYDLSALSKKVTARGKLINTAPELNLTGIRFTSTIPNGPSAVAPLQPDGSFEFPDIPAGAYRTGGFNGLRAQAKTILVIPGNVSGLTIDMRNNPFPEFFDVRPERTAFTDGRSTEITGVVTQRLTNTGDADSAYFRMNVKDAATGSVTPWAVFVEHSWQTPQIIVGETLTVPGVPANDGTNRLSAYPF